MFKLRRAIGGAALWIPARLWSFAAMQDGSGDISRYQSAELADALRYSGDADNLVSVLKDAGYLDASGQIVGWTELFALADSRKRSASKAAKARWSPRTRSDPNQTREEEKRGERGEAHALPDGMRDASSHSRTNAPLFSLNDSDRSDVSREFGISNETVLEAVRIFRENKSAYPSDPQTPEAFRGWLRTSTEGKRLISKPRATNDAARAGNLDEPPGWREWVRENCADPTNADRAWSQMDAAAQRHIRGNLMKPAKA